MKRWISSLLAAALCLSLLIAPAGAYTRVDPDKEVSLSLTYTYDGAGVKDLKISLYKVYNMTDAVRFNVTDAFQTSYGDEFDFDLAKWYVTDETTGETQVNWTNMAKTLESLLQRDSADPKVQPLLTETTDENGTVKFESKDADAEAGTAEVKLTAGLYLVMGETLVSGRYTYTPQTFLVSLPHLVESDDTWESDYVYTDLVAHGKLNVSYDSPDPGGSGVSITVVKEWVDDGADVTRPASVRVQLLRNGSPTTRTATLNEDNGWKYTWNNLASGSQWSVAEVNVPEGYSVEISQVGNDFVVTNTAETELDEDDTPLGPGPGDDPGNLPDVDLGDDDIPLSDGDVPTGSLPNTGTLWWPVQLLTAAGIVLFSAGWLDMRRNKKNSNEK